MEKKGRKEEVRKEKERKDGKMNENKYRNGVFTCNIVQDIFII